jgi:D-alanine-D-alanine ligase
LGLASPLLLSVQEVVRMKRRIGVLMGGWGEEREISLKTGEAVALALEANGHDVARVRAGPGLDQALRAASIELAFLALHGRMGEDGRVQGLLEVLGVPYTGSGLLASALAMNKPFARQLFQLHNLPTAPGYVTAGGDDALDRHSDLGFPCVVKPACGGSSVGLSVVRAPGELAPAIERARCYGGSALVERQVVGREVTVGILGDEVLGSCEVAFPGPAFDFAHKYQGGTQYHLPPRLPVARLRNLETLALAAYRTLGCRGYARVDLIAADSANEVLLEVNTLPGLTQTSLLPKIAQAAGLPFSALVERIAALATVDGEQLRSPPGSSRKPGAEEARLAS